MSPGNVSPGNVYCLNIMSADVARSHGGDGGGDDRPPSHVVPTGCGGCFANKGKGRTWILPLDRDQRKGINIALAKSLQYQQGSFPRPNNLGSSRFKIGKPAKERGHQQTGIPRQASDTQEYPSLIDTFWRTHTVDGVFPKDEDRRIYEEMKRLEATGEYTEDEINALARGGKLRGHIPGVGRVLPSRATSRPSMPAPDKSLKSMHRKVDFMMSLFRSDSKYSDMFKEFESGGASGSGGCGDDEEGGDDEDGDSDD
ncbi:hypothetical protein Tco_1504567 [Tanacetum coccineum]